MSPIQLLAYMLGLSKHAHVMEVLVPEQCATVSINGKTYHITIEEVLS